MTSPPRSVPRPPDSSQRPQPTGASSPAAIVVLCTAPADGGHALRLAQGLVETHLAACVNLIEPVRSVYRWQGQIEEASEVQLVIKARGEDFALICAWLEEHHPYDVPEVLALAVEHGSVAYLGWLGAQTERAADAKE